MSALWWNGWLYGALLFPLAAIPDWHQVLQRTVLVLVVFLIGAKVWHRVED